MYVVDLGVQRSGGASASGFVALRSLVVIGKVVREVGGAGNRSVAEKGLVRVEVVGLLGGVDELADLGGTLDEAAAGLVAADVCLL